MDAAGDAHSAAGDLLESDPPVSCSVGTRLGVTVARGAPGRLSPARHRRSWPSRAVQPRCWWLRWPSWSQCHLLSFLMEIIYL